MKRIFLTAVFAAIAAIPAFSLTFDVKVKAKDSLKLAPLQAGLTYYLFERGDKVLPFSEDFAIWLCDYKKTIDGDRITVSFTMKITEAAFIKEPKSLASVGVAFEYSMEKAKDAAKGKGDSPLKETRIKLERFGKQTAFEARIGGKAAAEKMPELLRLAGVDAKKPKPQSRGFKLPKIELGFLPKGR